MTPHRAKITSRLPFEGAGVLIGGDLGLEEVGLLGEIGNLTHPWERILASELGSHVEAVKAAIGDILDVLAEEAGIQSEDTARHAILSIGDLKLDGLEDHGANLSFEFRSPDFWVLSTDSVDEIDTEVQVDRLVTHDVLELLADADHLVLALEGEKHHKSAIEEDALHDDVEANKVLEEGLEPLGGICFEALLHDGGSEAHLEGILVVDGGHLMVHVEDLTLIKRKTLDDVLEGVRVDRLFKGLTQHVLAGFRVGDVLEDREHDVVANEALCRAEEAEVAHDNLTLLCSQLVGLPELDVALHGDLIRHPVVGATFVVVIPGPGVLQGHELVHIDLLAVDETLLVRVNALGEIVEGGGLRG